MKEGLDAMCRRRVLTRQSAVIWLIVVSPAAEMVLTAAAVQRLREAVLEQVP